MASILSRPQCVLTYALFALRESNPLVIGYFLNLHFNKYFANKFYRKSLISDIIYSSDIQVLIKKKSFED